MAEETVSVEFCLLAADYFLLEDGAPVIRLMGKTREGKTVILFDGSFRPYFYVEPKGDAEALKRLFLSGIEGIFPEAVEILEKNLYGKKIKALKVVLRDPTTITKFKETVENFEGVKRTFEYNIAFYKRYLMDKGLAPLSWFMVVGEKAETHIKADITLKNFSIKQTGRESYPRVRVIGIFANIIKDSDGERIDSIDISGEGMNRRLTGENQIEIVKAFSDFIKKYDPDLICGYNSDSIAFRKIEEIAIKNNIRLDLGRGGENLIFVMKGKVPSASIPGRIHIDLYNFIENIFYLRLPTADLSLETVLKNILWGIRFRTKAEGIFEASKWLIPWIFEFSKASGEIPFDASRENVFSLLEWLYTRKGFEAGELVPNRPTQEEITARKQVTEDSEETIHSSGVGIQEGLALFDLSGIYPEIIISNSISPETFDCNCCREDSGKISVNGYHFCKKRRGFVPQVIEYIMGSIKSENSNQRRECLKILANSAYEYFGFPEARWYSLTCFKSTKTLGKAAVKDFLASLVDRYNIVYADTQSVLLKTGRMEEIDKILLDSKAAHIEFGGLYKSAVFLNKSSTGKNRYALLDVIGRVSTKGFEVIGREWCKLAKTAQEKVIETLLTKKDPIKAAEIVRGVLKDLRENKVDMKDLVLSVRLARPLDQQGNFGYHVTAAQKMSLMGRQVKQGDVISYVIEKGEGPVQNRAEPAETAKVYDPEYYTNNQILPAALKILTDFGFTAADFEGDEEGQMQLTNFIRKEK